MKLLIVCVCVCVCGTVYNPMFDVMSSIALYGISIGLFVAPGDFPSYMEFVKSLQLSPIILFPFKTVMAFPLVYHYMNGIRHLVSRGASEVLN